MLSIHSINLWQQLSVVIDGAIGALLGSLIGLERDRAGKSAGPRTMALVGATSAIVVAIGSIADINAKYGDPTRAMHAIITGIGFLGAGLIFTDKRGGITGVTTAATIFATAGMGSAVGLGFQVAGIGFTLIVLVVLRSTQFLEVAVHRSANNLEHPNDEEAIEPVIDVTDKAGKKKNKDK